jgi:hypothetical protein
MMARALSMLEATDWPLIFQQVRTGFFLSIWLSLVVILIKLSLGPLIGRPAMLFVVTIAAIAAYGWTYRQIKYSHSSKITNP